MKLSADADVVLDLHCDMHAVLHLFISREGLARSGAALAADLGAAATLYNEPYPESLTFSGVNSALWARLAARFPGGRFPQACLSATIEYRGQHDVNMARRGRRAQPVSLPGAPRRHFGSRRSAAAAGAEATPIGGHGCRLCAEHRLLTYHLPKGARCARATRFAR